MTSPIVPPAPDPGASAPPAPPDPPPATWSPDAWARGRRHRDDHRGSIIGGLVLILLGAAFLAQEFIPDLDIGRLWPVILIVIGVALVAASVRRSA